MRYSLILALLVALAPVALAQDAAELTAPTAPPAALSASELVAQGELDGRAAARQQPTGGRFFGGLAAGLGLGLIGTGIVYAAASTAPEIPPQLIVTIADQPAAYQAAYQEAYRNDLRSRRRSNAVIGGLVGTAAIVTVIVASQ